MSHTNFNYLKDEYSILYNIGQSAEFNLYKDPVTSLFKLRQFGEKLTELLFEEHYIEFPYENTFHNRLKTLQYENVLPETVKDLLFTIKNKGNKAVHDNIGSQDDAKSILYSAFKIAKWFYTSYGDSGIDITHVKFSLPANEDTTLALSQLESDYKDLEVKFKELLAQREIKEQPIEEKEVILKRSRKAASKIEMSEAETRNLIDDQLRAAGWLVDTNELNFKKNKTKPERGKNIAIAEWPTKGKWADYALFVGNQLVGIVEAKKYANDISTDLRQSKIYSSLAEDKYDAQILLPDNEYKVPFLFSTNGRPYLEQIKTKSGIWFLDARKDTNNARALKGWITPEGLISLLEKDIEESNQKLVDSDITYLQSKNGLGLRDYQVKAILAVEKELADKPDKNRALLAMATGTGKTRTIMGLCYRLIKANRFKRILFLVDRRLLAIQSIDAFKDNKIEDLNTFSATYKVEGLKDTVPDLETRLHFATVQGMVHRLFYNEGDVLPVDAYDCIIVDEAHRGYLEDREMDEEELKFKNQKDYVSKYRMVLDYFDAYAVGLTATPALHTNKIFGKSVFTYSYREAVIDGFLIDHDPPYIIKTKLSEEGIVWKKGERPKVYDKEDNQIIELEELDDELSIDIAGFNKMVITESFNRVVVRQLVQKIDPDDDAKTLVFAATDAHADRLVQYFREEYAAQDMDVPDDAIAKITGKSYNPHELVTRFKNEKFPNIAVTVDLLTTGIDVPAISNLVFLRRVRSRILYEQMLGRATRRCDEIGKDSFKIYDAVRVYETLKDYSQMKPVAPNPKTTFVQLVEELPLIESNHRAQKQLDEIIAKLQRKKNNFVGEAETQFKYKSQGKSPEEFIDFVKEVDVSNAANELATYTTLWNFLDEFKPESVGQYVSEHPDELLGTERGYGKGQQPEDYLESFKAFIEESLKNNKLTAINVICNRPKELDRASLKELKLALNEKGFNTRALNSAWKQSKNEDIAADIISFIRTLALDNALISHKDRIRQAVEKVRDMNDWSIGQKKWIDRFEKQLLLETILKKEDLDLGEFKEVGGYNKLNKVFQGQLDHVIDVLNENLYLA